MSEVSLEEVHRVRSEGRLLFDQETIENSIKEMARQLESRIGDEIPIVLSVMNGGLMTTSELMKYLQCEIQLDYLQVARYRDQTVGGSLHWHKEPALALKDRIVILVDDIFDEGYTMQELVSYCEKKGAKAVYSAVLLLKEKTQRETTLSPDIYGLVVEDYYVFGFGMDYKGYLRNLPQIYAVDE